MKKYYNTIDKAISNNRYVTIVIVVCAFGYILVKEKKMEQAINKSLNEVVVIDSNTGSSFVGERANKTEVLEIEIINHIQMFYNTFFTYDRNSIDENINKGLYLIGETGKELYKTYKSSGWISKIKTNNINVVSFVHHNDIEIESLKNKPYKFTAKGTQRIQRLNSVITNNLYIQGEIRRTARKKGYNPHGMIIDNLIILDNSTKDE